jgi:hypothetical protein
MRYEAVMKSWMAAMTGSPFSRGHKIVLYAHEFQRFCSRFFRLWYVYQLDEPDER